MGRIEALQGAAGYLVHRWLKDDARRATRALRQRRLMKKPLHHTRLSPPRRAEPVQAPLFSSRGA